MYDEDYVDDIVTSHFKFNNFYYTITVSLEGLFIKEYITNKDGTIEYYYSDLSDIAKSIDYVITVMKQFTCLYDKLYGSISYIEFWNTCVNMVDIMDMDQFL